MRAIAPHNAGQQSTHVCSVNVSWKWLVQVQLFADVDTLRYRDSGRETHIFERHVPVFCSVPIDHRPIYEEGSITQIDRISCSDIIFQIIFVWCSSDMRGGAVPVESRAAIALRLPAGASYTDMIDKHGVAISTVYD